MLDAAEERALVLASGQIFTLDLATGAQTIISDAETGSGPLLESMVDLALDAEQGRVLVVDRETAALVAVSLTTGARTVISDAETGSGHPLDGAISVVLDAEAGRALVVTDLSDSSLVAGDLSTGACTVISGATRGSGPALASPRDVVLDAANQRAIIADLSYGRLSAVDLATGNRSLVLEPEGGSARRGPPAPAGREHPGQRGPGRGSRDRPAHRARERWRRP